jgi:hypothetical protein
MLSPTTSKSHSSPGVPLSLALIVTDWYEHGFPLGSKSIGITLPPWIMPELGEYGTGLHCEETRNDTVWLLPFDATTGGGSHIKRFADGFVGIAEVFGDPWLRVDWHPATISNIGMTRMYFTGFLQSRSVSVSNERIEPYWKRLRVRENSS